jgi:hypothetical protein
MSQALASTLIYTKPDSLKRYKRPLLQSASFTGPLTILHAIMSVSSSTLDKILEQLIPEQKSKCRDDESMGPLLICKQPPSKINELKIILLAGWAIDT